MYQYTYGEILAESPVDARAQEGEVLDRLVGLLRAAERGEADAGTANRALVLANDLWSVFIKDLAHPENALPPALRAQLMSVGLWVLGETGRLAAGAGGSYGAIADICAVVRDGLR